MYHIYAYILYIFFISEFQFENAYAFTIILYFQLVFFLPV